MSMCTAGEPYFVSSGAYHAERWAILKDRSAPTRHKEGTLNLLVVANWTHTGGSVFEVRLCDPRDRTRTCTGSSHSRAHLTRSLHSTTSATPREDQREEMGMDVSASTTPRDETGMGVPPEVGDPVVHLARYDEAPSFGLSQCDVCVIEHVTIHASPGASVVATQSDATAHIVHALPLHPMHTLLTGVCAALACVLHWRVCCTGVCAALACALQVGCAARAQCDRRTYTGALSHDQCGRRLCARGEGRPHHHILTLARHRRRRVRDREIELGS
jgi:hypothetical protein